MDYSLPGSSVHGIFQARILEWGAISFPRRSSQARDWTLVSWIVGRRFTIWATRCLQDLLVKPIPRLRHKPICLSGLEILLDGSLSHISFGKKSQTMGKISPERWASTNNHGPWVKLSTKHPRSQRWFLMKEGGVSLNPVENWRGPGTPYSREHYWQHRISKQHYVSVFVWDRNTTERNGKNSGISSLPSAIFY